MAFSGENSESYYDEGLTASMKGELERAIACFEKAVQMDPAFLVAHHQLAKCYVRTGQAERAIHLLTQVVERKPDQTPPRLDLGFALAGAGREEEARVQFEQLVAVDPDNGRAELGLAKVAFAQGDWTGALVHAQRALELSGSSFAVLYLLGRTAKAAGNPALSEEILEQADRLLEKSVELQPDQPEGYYLRGEVAFVRGQYSTALENYRAAEDRGEEGKVYSSFGESFGMLDMLAKQGLCLQKLGRTDRAREIGERILKFDPAHALGKALNDLS
ncbi:MAG: tetratricopeptide repeat protein [bacterium]|nr:tetratricopeptide repeat protein [bacterium]